MVADYRFVGQAFADPFELMDDRPFASILVLVRVFALAGDSSFVFVLLLVEVDE